MTDLIISFDSEDPVTPQAADAERWWADALHERGLRGSFQLVAEMVRSLKRRGRDDVLAALARHEIGYHSDRHSLPPTHPVAVDGLPLAEAVAWLVRNEAAGLAELAATFGTWPASYCPPGDSWTPATLLAMGHMGVRVCCNDGLALPSRRPYWYCGALVANYDLDFQTFYDRSEFDLDDFTRRFEELRAATPEDGVIVLYTHPTRLVTAAFWDAPFYGGRDLPLADCPPAPLRPRTDVERNQARCRAMLDWLERHRGLRCLDFATLHAERARGGRDLATLLAEQGLRHGQEGLLPLREPADGGFLPAALLQRRRYRWPLYPPGFTGERLLDQAGRLGWTAAPAIRTTTAPAP